MLPNAYKAFLLRNNGGRPWPKYFNIRGFQNNPHGQVQDFFGIDDAVKSCDLLWNRMTFREIIPKSFAPIACEDGGSLICIDTAGNEIDKVMYWDFRGQTKQPSYDNVYLIANTFEAFLAGLHYFDPLAEPQK